MQLILNAGFCEAFRPTKVRKVKSFSRAGRVMRKVLTDESRQTINAYLAEQNAKGKGKPVEQERQKRSVAGR